MRSLLLASRDELRVKVLEYNMEWQSISVRPLVSIVVPTYNRAEYIGRALRSVLAQAISEIEIIVVDDASTDDTNVIVRRFHDPRIRYHLLVENSGASRARNIGASLATGEYIAFLDSDDEWLMNMLVSQLEIFEKNGEVDAVIAGFIRYYRGGLEYISPPVCSDSSESVIRALLTANFVSPQVLMLRKSCFVDLGGFDETLSHREDWDFGVRLLSKSKVGFVRLPLAFVYETPGNLSSMTEKKIFTLQLFLDKHKNLFASYPGIYSKHLQQLGHYFMLNSNPVKGRYYLRCALRVHRSTASALTYVASSFGCPFYSALFSAFRFVRGTR